MAVKVLLTRKFKKGDLAKANRLLMELRSSATLQKGYISGQTLIAADDPYKVLVISTWTSRQRWDAWHADKRRSEFTARVDEFLEEPEQVELYLVGDKGAEWVDMA